MNNICTRIEFEWLLSLKSMLNDICTKNRFRVLIPHPPKWARSSDVWVQNRYWATFAPTTDLMLNLHQNVNSIVTFQFEIDVEWRLHLKYDLNDICTKNLFWVIFAPKIHFEWRLHLKYDLSDICTKNLFWVTFAPKIDFEWILHPHVLSIDFSVRNQCWMAFALKIYLSGTCTKMWIQVPISSDNCTKI